MLLHKKRIKFRGLKSSIQMYVTYLTLTVLSEDPLNNKSPDIHRHHTGPCNRKHTINHNLILFLKFCRILQLFVLKKKVNSRKSKVFLKCVNVFYLLLQNFNSSVFWFWKLVWKWFIFWSYYHDYILIK